MNEDIAVHHEPVWRERADFIIRAPIPTDQKTRSGVCWEQLWCRQLADTQFEVCCIPFFVYDIALGDVVEALRDDKLGYVMTNVIKPSGRYCFRVWLGDAESPGSRMRTQRLVRRLGCMFEWRSRSLIAIDAETHAKAQALADQLASLEASGELVYETGRQ